MKGIHGLIKGIPEGYEKACFETGAIKRKREISEPSDLLYLCLLHLINGCSLIEIAEIARLTQIGEFSDVAFMKRFQQCKKWFEWINERIRPKEVIEYGMPEWLSQYRVLSIDASDVKEKGRSQRVYRLHYALDVFHANTVQFKITTNKTGDGLSNFSFQKDDLVLADRAYSTVVGMKHCIDQGASFIARVRTTGANLYDQEERVIDLLSYMQTHEDGEISGHLKGKNKTPIPVRVCFRRKTKEQIDDTVKRLKDIARRKKKNLQKKTLEFNEFIVLITNLPETIKADSVLSLYRLRWQVEIYFKRLKSILDYGELPKKTEESALSWLNGKIMVALLLEQFMSESLFSPEES